MLSRILIKNCGKIKHFNFNTNNNKNKYFKSDKFEISNMFKKFYSMEIDGIYNIGIYTRSFNHIYKNNDIGLNLNSVMHFIWKQVNNGKLSFYLPTIIYDEKIEGVTTHFDYYKRDANKLIELLRSHLIQAEYVLFKNQQYGDFYKHDSCLDNIDKQKIKLNILNNSNSNNLNKLNNSDKSMIKICSKCEKIDYYKIKIKITDLSVVWLDLCSKPIVR